MAYKKGDVLTELPKSIFGYGATNGMRAVFQRDNYAKTLTDRPGEWIVLDTMKDLRASKLHERMKKYNPKYNSKGFEFRCIKTKEGQIFLGRYNTELLA